MQSSQSTRTLAVRAQARRRRRLLLAVAAASIASNWGRLTVAQVLPATSTWTGLGSDGNWNTPGNWQSSTPPSPGDSIVFTGSNGLVNFNDYPANTVFSAINFNSLAGAFTINGNDLQDVGMVNDSASVQTVNSNLSYTASRTISTNHGEIVINGNLSGAATGMNKDGAGVLTLSGNNSIGTSSGSFNIAAGTLRLSSAASAPKYQLHLASGTVQDNIGSTLDLDADSPIDLSTAQVYANTGAGVAAIDVSRSVNGAGSGLTHSIGSLTVGANAGQGVILSNDHGYGLSIGTVTFTATSSFLENRFTGGGVLTLGRVKFAGPLRTANLTGTGYTSLAGSVSNIGTIAVGGGTVSLDNSSVISSGAITVNSGGVLTESVDNAIAGSASLIVSGGTAVLKQLSSYNGPTQLTSGTLSLQHSSAISTGPITVTGGLLTQNAAGGISGNASLNVAGGTAVLSQSNSFTGGTNVTAGTLAVSGAGGIGSGSVQLSGGTLSLQSADAIPANTLIVTGGTVVQTADNSLSGTTSLLVNGPTANISLTEANSHRGGTTVNSGTLILGATGAISAGPVIVNGGRLRQFAQTAKNAISGSASLTINGGTAVLNQPNDYTGGTTVSGGKLVVGKSAASVLGSGDVTVDSGLLTGIGVVSGRISIASGATFAPTVGQLNTGAVTLAGGSTFDLQYGSRTLTSSALNSSGAVVLGGATLPILSLTDLDADPGLVPIGTTFPIITAAGGVSGTFDGLPHGAGFTSGRNQFRIGYTATQVTLTADVLSSNPGTSDMRLLVNTTTGHISLLATTNVALTGYNISDQAKKLLSGTGVEVPLSQTASNKVNWTTIRDDSTTLAEGENLNKYKATQSSSWDTIQLSPGQTIDFGAIFNTTSGVHDLTFEFSEANTSTGDPTAGQTYTVGLTGVDYTPVPEPGGVALSAVSAMGLLARRRRNPRR